MNELFNRFSFECHQGKSRSHDHCKYLFLLLAMSSYLIQNTDDIEMINLNILLRN